jgi:hypothetical protein
LIGLVFSISHAEIGVEILPRICRGLLYGIVCHHWFPDVVPNPAALAVASMAAFFTAVVRTPVTGIVLVTEMSIWVICLSKNGSPSFGNCCNWNWLTATKSTKLSFQRSISGAFRSTLM